MSKRKQSDVNCPCKRKNCIRYQKCDACRKYHYDINELPSCERTINIIKPEI